MFYVMVKSGTNGYSDYDNCDLLLTEIPSSNIPRIGEILEFGDKENFTRKKYLVREIKRSYNFKTDKHEYGEWTYVYVINA